MEHTIAVDSVSAELEQTFKLDRDGLRLRWLGPMGRPDLELFALEATEIY